MVAVAGLTTMAVGVTALMANCALPETLPEDAVTRTVPGETDVANPCVGVLLLTVAIAGRTQDHVAVRVKSFVLPSEYFPVAVNDCIVPIAIDALLGLSWMDFRTTGPPLPGLAGVLELDTPPQLTRHSAPIKPDISNKQRISLPREI
jgi:hypothetical protein